VIPKFIRAVLEADERWQESKEIIKTELVFGINYIDPLDRKKHQEMKIVTEQVVSHPLVNLDKAELLRKQQLVSFECSWPGRFLDSTPKLVTIMAFSRKHIKVGDASV